MLLYSNQLYPYYFLFSISFRIQNYTLQISRRYSGFYIYWFPFLLPFKAKAERQKGRSYCYCIGTVYKYNILHITHNN